MSSWRVLSRLRTVLKQLSFTRMGRVRVRVRVREVSLRLHCAPTLLPGWHSWMGRRLLCETHRCSGWCCCVVRDRHVLLFQQTQQPLGVADIITKVFSLSSSPTTMSRRPSLISFSFASTPTCFFLKKRGAPPDNSLVVMFITQSIARECDSCLNKIANLQSQAEEVGVPLEWNKLLKALERPRPTSSTKQTSTSRRRFVLHATPATLPSKNVVLHRGEGPPW